MKEIFLQEMKEGKAERMVRKQGRKEKIKIVKEWRKKDNMKKQD